MPAQPSIARVIRCRYIKAAGQCTAEAVDPLGPVLLCQQHLARTMELLTDLGFTFQPPTSTKQKAAVK